MTRWLSVTQAAPRLHLTRQGVRAAIRRGDLPAVKVETSPRGRWRIAELAIAEYYLDRRWS